MSNAPFEIKTEVLLKVYYHELLTIYAGMKFSEKYPAFESIGITLQPNPSIVVSFSNNSIMEFLVRVIEPLRKRYRHGMWSPGQAVTKERAVFSFFTHDNENYVKEFLDILGCNNTELHKSINGEFTRPDNCTLEFMTFNGLVNQYSVDSILGMMAEGNFDSNKMENLLNRFCLINCQKIEFELDAFRLSQKLIDFQCFLPIKVLVKNGFDLAGKADRFPSLLDFIEKNLHDKNAVDLIQFALRYYCSAENSITAREIIALCGNHQVNVDQPGLPSGMTALHWASKKGNDEIRDLLIASGASVSKQDAKNMTPDLYYEQYMGEHSDSKSACSK